MSETKYSDSERRVLRHIGPILGSIIESNQKDADRKALAMKQDASAIIQ